MCKTGRPRTYDDSCKVASLQRNSMPQKCGDKHATSRVSIDVRADRAVAAATGSRRDRGDGFIAGGIRDKKSAQLCARFDRSRSNDDSRHRDRRRLRRCGRTAARRHRRSTVNRRGYQQQADAANAVCRTVDPDTMCVHRRHAAIQRFSREERAAMHRAPRSRVRTESTRDETAATCAAPSRGVPRSGWRANRSQSRSRRPTRRTPVHASRA